MQDRSRQETDGKAAPTARRAPWQSGTADQATIGRESRITRRGLALLALAAALVAGAWWLWGRGAEATVARPTRGDAAEVVYATGIVEPTHWAKVAALQRKRIVELCDCEGRNVAKGDVLGRLDDVEERAVLTELEARLARHREDVARLKTLVDRNVTSRTTYEDKLTQLSEYEAKVAAQKDRISDLVLRAPMDGVVLRRDGEVGEIAGTGASDVLLWVGQPHPLRVVAEVNEDDIAKVATSQKVLLRHEGIAGTALTASVASVTPKGDPQTKTFRVYLDLPASTPLKIGMSVEANIVVREVRDVLLVPAEALSGTNVQVLDGGRIRRRTVDPGIRGAGRAEVRSGLSGNDVVITPYRSDLADGSRVRVGNRGGSPR